jgi:hypothetical protein
MKRLGLCHAVLTASFLLSSWSEAAHMCIQRLDIIGYETGRLSLWTRAGGDFVGCAIVEVTVCEDSVKYQMISDMTADSTQYLCRYESIWDNWNLLYSVNPSLSFPHYGITITAPDSVRDVRADPYVRREPVVHGARARVLFWQGGAKYLNYGLRSAVVDTATGYVFLVTWSDWRKQEIGYDRGCNVGDGLIVMKLDRGRK